MPVREQGLDHVRGDRLPLLQGADHEYAPGHVRRDPQLLGPHIDIPQHDVIGDDVLDEGPPVMFLLVVGFGCIQRTVAMAQTVLLISLSPKAKAA